MWPRLSATCSQLVAQTLSAASICSLSPFPLDQTTVEGHHQPVRHPITCEIRRLLPIPTLRRARRPNTPRWWLVPTAAGSVPPAQVPLPHLQDPSPPSHLNPSALSKESGSARCSLLSPDPRRPPPTISVAGSPYPFLGSSSPLPPAMESVASPLLVSGVERGLCLSYCGSRSPHIYPPPRVSFRWIQLRSTGKPRLRMLQ
ncbi:hypothetical protein BS78_02G387500 [Paspalum vaginatum]|nr:hypothetical protein BS78_02G387500 [Paspalum vaginatum]